MTHLTKQQRTDACPHGVIGFCARCDDPARLTAAANMGDMQSMTGMATTYTPERDRADAAHQSVISPDGSPGASHGAPLLTSKQIAEDEQPDLERILGCLSRSDRAVIEKLGAEIERLRADFKNFHRALCERFGYAHDETDWHRDQVSLIEHIAKRMPGDSSAPETSGELERLRKLEEHIERVACWVNPQDVYLEIRRTRDDIYNAREERRRTAHSAQETSVSQRMRDAGYTSRRIPHEFNAENGKAD